MKRISASLQKLDKKARMYLLKRDAPKGYANCITCGALKPAEELDVSHFIGRVYKSVRWLPENIHLQCRKENRFLEGQKDQYAFFLVRKYGPEILEKLERAKWLPYKFDPFEEDRKLDELIKALDS